MNHDPDIIEAAARARLLNMLRHYPAQPLIPEHLRPNKLMAEAADMIEQLEKNTERIANMVLTAATPLILERAAKVTEDYDRDGAFAWMARDIAAAIRALKGQP